jgi:hypothetical protein
MPTSDAQLDAAIEGELRRLGASFVAELFVRIGAGRPGIDWDDIAWALLRLRARGAVKRHDMRAGPPWRRRTAAVVYRLTERRVRELRADVAAGRDGETPQGE